MLACALVLLLAGCSMPTRVDGGNAANPSQSREVHLDLINDMLTQHQYYAALAHIEDMKRSGRDSLELRYLEAETRRRLGQRMEAGNLYRGLIGTSYEGRAYHGLGLLNANYDLGLSIRQLNLAVQRQPTDAQFRNDLGYALMKAGRYPEAMTQLATATELDQRDMLARHNLVILLLLTHDDANARRVAGESGIDDKQLAGLRREAQALAQARPAGAGGVR